MTWTILYEVVVTLAALVTAGWAIRERVRRLDDAAVGRTIARSAAAVFDATNVVLLTAKLHTLRHDLLDLGVDRWPTLCGAVREAARIQQRALADMVWPSAPKAPPALSALCGDWQLAPGGTSRRLWMTGETAARVYRVIGCWRYVVQDPWCDTMIASDTALTEGDAQHAADAVLRAHVVRAAAFFGGGSATVAAP